MRTTVACVWVEGHVPYGLEYVVNLAAMVKRAMDRPYRFVCLTDRPAQLPACIETATIPSPAPLMAWWSKVLLFSNVLGWTGRVLYLDLDSLVVGSLAPVLNFRAPFALVPHAGNFTGRDGRQVIPRFNSSVMVWDIGEPFDLFSHWTPDVAKHLWGDQDWIGQQRPDAAVMPLEWFPRISSCGAEVPPSAKVVLCKKPKNAEAAKRWPWVDALWRAA